VFGQRQQTGASKGWPLVILELRTIPIWAVAPCLVTLAWNWLFNTAMPVAIPHSLFFASQIQSSPNSAKSLRAAAVFRLENELSLAMHSSTPTANIKSNHCISANSFFVITSC
ncbi:hypothetical protein WBQ28_24495, partial [Pseudomonas syringae pv. syringae]|uniref:hypothetical protein n=1 Tax=Pseudomonas syringae TaxID=317 RepID=UPI003B0076BA